jgi:aminomethyltransferase
MAPTVGKGIGMGYVKTDFADVDSEIYIQIRNNKVKAKVVKMPFYKK